MEKYVVLSQAQTSANFEELFDNAITAYTVVFYVVLGLTIILVLLRWYYAYQLNQAHDLNQMFLFNAAAIFLQSFGDMFTYMNISFGLFWFFGFLYCNSDDECKNTFEVPNNDYFRVLTLISFIFKSIAILYYLMRQCNHDIFFIDWENPKGFIQDEGMPKVISNKPSAFRHLKLCDKWNALQTVRVTSLPFTLIMTCLVMQISQRSLPFEHTSPIYSREYAVMRYGFISLVFVVVASVQFFFFNFIWYRWVRDPCRDFVEELCLCNISMILLPDKYHGYYVHGKSVHQYSDTHMLQILTNIQYEKENRVNLRSLVPGDNTTTFEIFLKQQVREAYDKNYMDKLNMFDLNTTGSSLQMNTNLQSFKARTDAFDYLNKFFKHWIDKISLTHEIQVEQRGIVPTIMEIPPDMAHLNYSVFYRDKMDNIFRAVTLGGMEWDLLLHELLTFIFFDYVCQNFSIWGAFFTFVISMFFKVARGVLGRNNIAHKTLTDKRLL